MKRMRIAIVGLPDDTVAEINNQFIMAKSGFRTDFYRGNELALDRVEGNLREYALIILNPNICGWNSVDGGRIGLGVQIVERWRKSGVNTPIIGVAAACYNERLLAAGFSQVEDLNPENIARAARQIVNGALLGNSFRRLG